MVHAWSEPDLFQGQRLSEGGHHLGCDPVSSEIGVRWQIPEIRERGSQCGFLQQIGSCEALPSSLLRGDKIHRGSGQQAFYGRREEVGAER